jgi:hypothetical protein
MGLLPARPAIEVFAPSGLYVGATADVRIEIVAERDTPIDFIEVRAIGAQGWAVGVGDSRTVERVSFPELVARVADAGRLPPGRTTYHARFALPPGMAPSHKIDPAWARFELRVHVSIPWWLDGRERFVIPVRLPPPRVVQREPVAARSTARVNSPRIEVSLASKRVVVGETVVGSCAVFHMDDRDPRDVDLQVVPVFELHRRGRSRQHRGNAYHMTLTLPAGSAGTSVPFRMTLPPDVPPSFATHSHTLSWQLVAAAGRRFAGKIDVAVPLELVDASAATATEPLQIAPRLADDHVGAVFARYAAETGWQHVREDSDPAIERSSPGGDLRIRYSYRGSEGTYLVAQLAHPRLGLGLEVRRATLLDRLTPDLEIDLPGWDRAHYVTVRAPAQATPFLAAAVPAVLATIAHVGKLVQWSDERIVFERPILGVDPSDLRQLDESLEVLASALADARATIAPPPGLAVDVAAWHALARHLHGELVVGDLSIDGELDRAPVQLRIDWEDEQSPVRVRAYVEDPATESTAPFAIDRPATDAAPDHLPEHVRPLLARWPVEIIALRFTAGVASAAWSIEDGIADASRARRLVDALRGLLVALDPMRGPYR